MTDYRTVLYPVINPDGDSHVYIVMGLWLPSGGIDDHSGLAIEVAGQSANAVGDRLLLNRQEAAVLSKSVALALWR